MFNTIFFVILAAILLDFLLDGIASRLNLSSMTDRIPKEFEGVYDEERYAKSQ
ncbi:MAG: M48 family peptidase, partial [Bacteroidetes bacterium]|nr:M48 family peptidase [Bacteroidota bacterium]